MRYASPQTTCRISCIRYLTSTDRFCVRIKWSELWKLDSTMPWPYSVRSTGSSNCSSEYFLTTMAHSMVRKNFQLHSFLHYQTRGSSRINAHVCCAGIRWPEACLRDRPWANFPVLFDKASVQDEQANPGKPFSEDKCQGRCSSCVLCISSVVESNTTFCSQRLGEGTLCWLMQCQGACLWSPTGRRSYSAPMSPTPILVKTAALPLLQ